MARLRDVVGSVRERGSQGADHRCERGFTDGREETRDEKTKGNGSKLMALKPGFRFEARV